MAAGFLAAALGLANNMPIRPTPSALRWARATVYVATVGCALGLPQLGHATPQAARQAAVAWAAQATGVPVSAVRSQPMDERLQLAACTQPLQVDAPFDDPARPRVRCEQPSWQVFVALTLPQAAAPSAQPTAANPTPPATTRQVVMLTTHLARGTQLTADVLTVRQVAAQQASGGVLERPEQAIGAELVRDLAPGRPLRRHDVRAAVLVKRGALVQITIGNAQRFAISARLVAQQDGRLGQQIKLKNPDTGRLVMGRVTGSNEVMGP